MAEVILKTAADRDAWVRCFAGAITGLLSSHQTVAHEPDQLLRQASKLADMALSKAQMRRLSAVEEDRLAAPAAAPVVDGGRRPARRDVDLAEALDPGDNGHFQNGAPAFPFYASDFLTATGLMSNAAVGAHIRMMAYAWSNGPIMNTPVALARAMQHSVGDPPFKDIWAELEQKWFLTKRGWINCRLEVVRWERASYIEKKQAKEAAPPMIEEAALKVARK